MPGPTNGDRNDLRRIENCIKCKYQDCVEVCPVDCFYGENMLVINQLMHRLRRFEPECPAEAIVPIRSRMENWLEITQVCHRWPNITRRVTRR